MRGDGEMGMVVGRTCGSGGHVFDLAVCERGFVAEDVEFGRLGVRDS